MYCPFEFLYGKNKISLLVWFYPSARFGRQSRMWTRCFFIENSWSFGNAKQAGPFGPSWPPARSLWILLFDFDVSLVIAVRLLGYLSFYLATQRAFPLWLPHSLCPGCHGSTTSLSRLVIFSAPAVGAESFVCHTDARALSPRLGCTGVRRLHGVHPILMYKMAPMLRTRRWWRLGLGQVGVDAAGFATPYGKQHVVHRPGLHQCCGATCCAEGCGGSKYPTLFFYYFTPLALNNFDVDIITASPGHNPDEPNQSPPVH